MNAKLLDDRESRRTFVLIFETGDHVIEPLQTFATEQGVSAAHFTAIGAFERVALGYFNWQRKDYDRIEINEQVEVVVLTGDIALQGIDAKVHAHVVVGKSDGTAHGGHLIEARVRPTLELVLTELPAYLRRRADAETGLALIDVDAAE